MKARIEVKEKGDRHWRKTRWGYEDSRPDLGFGEFISLELAKELIKSVRKRFHLSQYRLVYEKRRTHKNTRRLTAAERTRAIINGGALAVDIKRQLQLHASAALKRHARVNVCKRKPTKSKPEKKLSDKWRLVSGIEVGNLMCFTNGRFVETHNTSDEGRKPARFCVKENPVEASCEECAPRRGVFKK